MFGRTLRLKSPPVDPWPTQTDNAGPHDPMDRRSKWCPVVWALSAPSCPPSGPEGAGSTALEGRLRPHRHGLAQQFREADPSPPLRVSLGGTRPPREVPVRLPGVWPTVRPAWRKGRLYRPTERCRCHTAAHRLLCGAFHNSSAKWHQTFGLSFASSLGWRVSRRLTMAL